jgi:hypothetical protein
MNATENRTYAVGDLVVPNPDAGWSRSMLGKTYRISKVPVGARGVNYTADASDGGRGLRGPADAFLPADAAPTVTAVPVPVYEPTPPVGTVVTVTGVAKINPRDLYVVTAESRKPNCVRLSRLGGGDGSRYWPSIPVRLCTVVPLNEIGSRL